jgi:hypothetical protein
MGYGGAPAYDVRGDGGGYGGGYPGAPPPAMGGPGFGGSYQPHEVACGGEGEYGADGDRGVMKGFKKGGKKIGKGFKKGGKKIGKGFKKW